MKKAIVSLVSMIILAGCGEQTVATGNPPRIENPIPGNPYQQVLVTGSVVNLRQGPGTQYAVVGRAVSGDTLMVTGEAPDWYRIYVPDKSLFAWIYSPLTSGTIMPGQEE